MKDNLFYCYSNRLNTFLSLFGFVFIDKGQNQKGQSYKVYKKNKDLDFALTKWEELKSYFPYEKVERKIINL